MIPGPLGSLRIRAWDALFIVLAGLHGVVLLASMYVVAGASRSLAGPLTIVVVAFGVWWSSNTIAHNFIHRPFFRARWINLLFSAYLTVLLGIPQSVWRQRHLAHHAGTSWRLQLTHPFTASQIVGETLLVSVVWMFMAFITPHIFTTAYLPGFAIGLALCALHGHYEHVRETSSHYGAFYNFLFFNDGYHAEHHAYPGVPWRTLPSCILEQARSSHWPPVLRWIEAFSLEGLERLVLRSSILQRLVLRSHRKAIAALVESFSALHRVAIVGGGLYPRTALILRELLPESEIVIIDASAVNLDTARSLLDDRFEFVRRCFQVSDDEWRGVDLLVIPLSFRGDREAVYRHPPAKVVLVHDWIWRRRGEGRRISLALLKRVNLLRGR